MKRSVPKIILIAFSLLAFMFVLVGTTLFSRNEATVSVLDFSKAVTELNSKNTDVNFSPVILNDELLTEDANTTIGLNDFCQQTNTNVEYVGNNINLSFGEYSATINTQEGLIYTNTNKVIKLSDNFSFSQDDCVVSVGDICQSLGFEQTQLSSGIKISRTFQTKRLIVNSANDFDNCGATTVVEGYRNFHILQYESEIQTQNAYNYLSNIANISWVEPDIVVSLQDSLPENITAQASSSTFYSWGGTISGFDDFQQYLSSTVGVENLPEVVVAVIDTGIDSDHTMFKDRIITKYGVNFVDSSNTNNPEDDEGHGTHVSGIICDLTYSNVKILPLKVLNHEGKGYLSNILNAMNYASDLKDTNLKNLCAVNMSLGGDYSSYAYSSYKSAVDELYAKNVLTVVAAGNEGENADQHVPACVETAISVSAVGLSGTTYYSPSWSNFGSDVDISAPGVSIESAYVGGGYATLSGTSMAAPHVSAAVSLIFSDTSKTLSLSELESLLEFFSLDLGMAGFDEYYGEGMLDLTYADAAQLPSVKFSNTTTTCEESFFLTLSCADAEATIIYTTDGTIPKLTNGTVYTQPFEIVRSTNVKAIALVSSNGEVLKCSKVSSITYKFPGDTLEPTFTISNDGTLLSYSGILQDIVVPNQVDDITVVAIGEYCFSQANMSTITLPITVELIDSCAFLNCQYLTTVNAPGVISVGQYAFAGCVNLQYLSDTYFPNLQEIGLYGFAQCYRLSTINLSNLQYISDNAFDMSYGISYLVSISMPEVLSIGKSAFYNCSKLISVSLPNVQIVSQQAFQNCNLSDISLPEAVVIGDYAFIENENLTMARFEKAIYIGDYCFSDFCTRLSSVYAPQLQIVGNSAFYKCNLTAIDFPNLTFVGPYAFSTCNIQTVNTPRVATIKHLGFYNNNIQTINLPNVAVIDEFAFAKNTNLTTVNLSSCIIEMNGDIFEDIACTIYGYIGTVAETYCQTHPQQFSAIQFEENCLRYTISNNEVYITGTEGLSDFITIPNYIRGLPVTRIMSAAFRDCNYIKSINLSEVEIVEDSAFENCLELLTIKLPKVKQLGEYSFKGCNALVSVEIPVVEKVGAYSFLYCYYLKELSLPSTITEIGEKAFGYSDLETLIDGFVVFGHTGTVAETYCNNNGITFLSKFSNIGSFYYSYYIVNGIQEICISYVEANKVGAITLPDSYDGYTISKIGSGAFQDCNFITEIHLPESFKIIESYAFQNCSLLQSINLENISTLGQYAFQNCENLISVNLPKIETINQGSFLNCTSLKTVVAPNATVINAESFKNCIKLTEFVGDKVISVGNSAFYGANNLDTFNFDNVISVDQLAFSGCFENIYLKNIQQIGYSAFSNCQSLKKVVINNTITSIGSYAFTNTYGITIYGYTDTVAKTFADNNSIPFVAICDLELTSALPDVFEVDNGSVNHTLTISTQGYELSYKWFKNSVKSLTGATQLSSTTNSLVIDKMTVDNFYVFCEITSWKNEVATTNICNVIVRYYTYYTITATAGEHGSISPEGVSSVRENSSLTYTFDVDLGYEIESVYVDGVNVGILTTFTFEDIDKNHTIQVNFKIIVLKITASAGANGHISPAGVVAVNYGSPQSFSFTADDGYEVDKVFVDGVEKIATNNAYTFLYVSKDSTINVTFKLKTYNITVEANGANFSPESNPTIYHGDTFSISFTDSEKFVIDNVIVDGITFGRINTYTFNYVTSDHSIRIETSLRKFTITLSSGENGNPTESFVKVTYGEDATVSFTANTGFEVATLEVDGVLVVPASEYIFKDVTSDHTVYATFKLITYTVTITYTSESGKVSDDDFVFIEYGNTHSYQIVPKESFNVHKVLVNNVEVELQDGNIVTLDNITSDTTIDVILKKSLDIPITIILLGACLLVVGISVGFIISRKIKLKNRRKSSLTTMIHISSKKNVGDIKVKEEYLTETKKKRKKD